MKAKHGSYHQVSSKQVIQHKGKGQGAVFLHGIHQRYTSGRGIRVVSGFFALTHADGSNKKNNRKSREADDPEAGKTHFFFKMKVVAKDTEVRILENILHAGFSLFKMNIYRQTVYDQGQGGFSIMV
jgi:hypothetical protein